MKLNELPSGTRAIVHRIDVADVAVQRLMAMGLCVGREVEVVRQGNPLIVRMLGARIGVSGRVAQHILVHKS
jgi:Fe2+ transport system protein FeoA